MDLGTIINFLLLIGAIQGFIFIGATFFLRRRIEATVLFLNLFVLFLSLNNLQSWLLESKFLKDPLETYYAIPWYILIVPMFYSFLLHYLEIDKKKKPLFWLSSLLFLGAVISRVWLVHNVGTKRISIGVLQNYNLIEDCFVLGYSLVLYFLSIDIVRRQQKLYQNILTYDDLKWVRRFLRWGGLIFILWGIAVLLNIFSENIKAPSSYYPLRLVSSILIYWVGYQGFFRYRLLKDRVELRQIINRRQVDNNQEVSKAKNAKAKLTFEQFENHFEASKAYLNPNLSLDASAENLGVSISTLSRIINEKGIGFSDFVNTARVNEAKKILKDPEFKNYTIVAIGLECGFNSKSTFYAAFRKLVDMSPSEYRSSNTH